MDAVNGEIVRLLAQNGIALQNSVNEYSHKTTQAISKTDAILSAQIRLSNEVTGLEGQITESFGAMAKAINRLAAAVQDMREDQRAARKALKLKAKPKAKPKVRRRK
jgi:hypothetical protein